MKNIKRPINDIGIRHRARLEITRNTSLHLTVKILKEKSRLRTKALLQILKRAIQRGRVQGLRIHHYTLEHDHVHLIVEARNNYELGKGMQAFGVCFAKGINKCKSLKGAAYKHRYHLRKINSARDLKTVMRYVFNNSKKHRNSLTMVHPFNSITAELKHKLFTKEKVVLDRELMALLDPIRIFYNAIEFY